MATTSSIPQFLPICFPTKGVETQSSKKLRIAAIALGTITALAGLFLLWAIPQVPGYGAAFFGGGFLFIMSAVFLRCVREKPTQPIGPTKSDKKEKEAESEPKKPEIVEPPRTFLDIVDPRPENPPVLPIPPTPMKPPEGETFLTADFVSLDMCLHIISFLRPRELLNLMHVSKEWCRIARSNISWRPLLEHMDYRICPDAPTMIFSRTESEGYSYEDQLEWRAFDQFRAYHDLKKRGFAGPSNDFFDYLARRMPGGPLAFQRISFEQYETINDITAEEMVDSVVRGEDANNQIFLALRLVDTDTSLPEEARKPFVLLFVKGPMGWKQEAAKGYWKQNELNVTEQTDLNYVLALVSGSDLATRSCFNDPRYFKTLKLA